ncbi:MAG: hypothetical protein P1P90_06245 [Patescibacteria group bacterium]|nr:hypothetical protein [Patescibacteria group bacterium]
MKNSINLKFLMIDRRFRIPRIWSNHELKKFAHLFEGDIVNVSGWQDKDKEGDEYKNYFKNKKSYTITNYKPEACGYQGMDGELFLNLEDDLPEELVNKFDLVFNHTVLEHVFEIEKAFQNLCLMSKDVIIIVIPFLQEMHTSYGDFWRMTPLALKRMFDKNNCHLQYLTFNGHRNASVYLFAIAVKDRNKWENILPSFIQEKEPDAYEQENEKQAGCNAVYNRWYKALQLFGRIFLRNK